MLLCDRLDDMSMRPSVKMEKPCTAYQSLFKDAPNELGFSILAGGLVAGYCISS